MCEEKKWLKTTNTETTTAKNILRYRKGNYNFWKIYTFYFCFKNKKVVLGYTVLHYDTCIPDLLKFQGKLFSLNVLDIAYTLLKMQTESVPLS